ncbi:hypothetical protein [Citrobacter amalonaticus]|uniref:hypothetical protein n=1 Tax=Citrobacter amalonaticus TaxID=35703 RepID=UPI003AAB0D0B
MVIVVAVLCILLANSRSDVALLQSENDVLHNDNSLQGQVIATQAFNFNRFNQIAEFTNRNNSLIDASADKTVIEYREILHREKTCDLPIPADVAGGLLEYAHRLRASAMHPDTRDADTAGDGAITTGTLTYCQAVLWIKPLLAVIEKANNQLAGIRQIEQERQ